MHTGEKAKAFYELGPPSASPGNKTPIMACIFSFSPQFRSLFLASLRTVCLTVRAYLNRQKYGLFYSLHMTD